MIRSAVTISLVKEAQGGPFVFWHDLPGSIRRATELGFDAVELFLPGPDEVAVSAIHEQLDATGLKVAAVGTGAGMVRHQLSLTSPDPDIRKKALAFILRMIQFGGELGAPAIIGSMQGRWSPQIPKDEALHLLTEALRTLSAESARFQVPLIYEPLNRYETNLVNTLGEGVQLIQEGELSNVRLLADLFHMNVEESDLPLALRQAGAAVGHLHFVDSNRRPAGAGHLDFEPIAQALREMNYQGYASAEALPLPDSESAARQTIETFRSLFPR